MDWTVFSMGLLAVAGTLLGGLFTNLYEDRKHRRQIRVDKENRRIDRSQKLRAESVDKVGSVVRTGTPAFAAMNSSGVWSINTLASISQTIVVAAVAADAIDGYSTPLNDLNTKVCDAAIIEVIADGQEPPTRWVAECLALLSAIEAEYIRLGTSEEV